MRRGLGAVSARVAESVDRRPSETTFRRRNASPF